MTSAGLKRPSDFDLNPHTSGPSGAGPIRPVANSNKRRCINSGSQTRGEIPGLHSNSPFKDSSMLLAPLSDDLSQLIRDEMHRIHNRNHNNDTDPPILTARQTQLICEKLIREREQKIRQEYDKILINKLAEQYDTFVRYTHDHLEKRYNESNSHQTSYLS